MHQQSLILLHPTVKEKMHVQKSTLLQNVAQYPLHHMTYAPTEFEVTTSKISEEKHLQEISIFDICP